MKMISDRAETLFEQEVGPIPVTAAQCRVLMYLKSREGEAISQRDLERHLCVSHTTVKGLLNRLEEKGMVRTAFDGEDGRVKHVYMTEDVEKRHEGLREEFKRIEARLLAGFSQEEQQQLHDLLTRAFNNIMF